MVVPQSLQLLHHPLPYPAMTYLISDCPVGVWEPVSETTMTYMKLQGCPPHILGSHSHNFTYPCFTNPTTPIMQKALQNTAFFWASLATGC